MLTHARDNDVLIQARDNTPRRAHNNSKAPMMGRMSRKRLPWWMCRNCCELGHDHTKCTKLTSPEAEKRFHNHVREHKAKEAQRVKSKERNAAQTDNKPVHSPRTEGKKALTCRVNTQYPFKRSVVEADDSDNYTANMATTQLPWLSISPWHIVGFLFLLTATACACVFGSPQLTMVTVGLLSAEVLQITSPIIVVASHYQGASTQSISMAILLMAIIGLQLVNGAQATYSSQHALMTNNGTDRRVWIDTGCNKTLFQDESLLINMHNIPPTLISGAQVGSHIICRHQGDYPLLLKDAHGQFHLRMITDVLVSPQASHNLLAMHDLRKANICLDFPIHKKKPGFLKINTTSGQEAVFNLTPKNKLYPLQHYNLSDTRRLH